MIVPNLPASEPPGHVAPALAIHTEADALASTEKIVAVISRIDVLMSAARLVADGVARHHTPLARAEADAVLRSLMIVRREVEGLLPRPKKNGRRMDRCTSAIGKHRTAGQPAAPE